MSKIIQQDLKLINIANETRKDPTTFLPKEEMSYEIKRKKKKKKRDKAEDPFKGIDDANLRFCSVPTLEMCMDPEVTIKVENIEVDLGFNDMYEPDSAAMDEGFGQDIYEPAVKIEEQNHEAAILTFENVVNNDKVIEEKYEPNEPATHFCKICHLVFKTIKTLRVHQKRKHKVFRKSFIHVCDYCGMSYDQKTSLQAHIKRKHKSNISEEDLLEKLCDICSLVFKGTSRLRLHMRRKHGLLEESFKFSCGECGLSYDKYRSLTVHMMRKHTNKKPILNHLYTCPFCPKVFNRRETYCRHMQRKHRVDDDDDGPQVKMTDELLESYRDERTGEIICKECPLVFSSLNFLKLHMRRKHNALTDDFTLKCRICHMSYDKVESLKRHVRRKHYPGKSEVKLKSTIKEIKECELCGLIFASQGGLAKHLRCTHKIDSPKTFFCNVCNEGFCEKRQLKPHFLKVHLKVSYTCKVCKKIFKAKESYRRHILFKHPMAEVSQEQMQKCDQCSETFVDEFELCKHINMLHNVTLKSENCEVKIKQEEPTKPTFQCIKCSDTYDTWDHLKVHYDQCHKKQEMKVEAIQCQVCGEFLPSTDMQKHMKLHNEIEMECKYCEFKSKNKASMTQHLLRHKNAKTLRCEYTGCRYKTFYEDAMRKHKNKHADIGVKLQCTRCPFQTMNKYILKYHEEAHETGKKRYQCDKCDYATILPANLVQHKYKHSAEKRFKCEVCPFATKYNTSLRFHVRKKHCDLPTFS